MISISECREFITDVRNNVGGYINRKRLKNKEFTIISNDCYGAELYRDLGLEYKTPFIGLMVPAPCYIKLLNNLKEYLDSPLSFINTSRYEYMNELRQTLPSYPIGKLGEEVEIHFIHYASDFEAREKWERRLKRISWNNIFVGFVGDKDLCTEEILSKFESLHFKNKVVFTAIKYKNLNTSIYVKDYVTNGARMYRKSLKYFDIIGWLNGQDGKLNTLHRILFVVLYSKRT